MVLGMSLAAFTALHVIISLVGIASGLMVLFGWLTGRRFDGFTALFLVTTLLTSLTGFAFPVEHLLPSHIVGIISLVVLAIAIAARYVLHLSGVWRPIYVVSGAVALYLNVFVLVIQSFLKVAVLKELAPTQKEPPFLIAQTIVLLLFVTLTFLAAKRFRLEPARAT